MRIIDTIAHPQIRISIFQMNQKYIVKLELGAMEQSFKFSELDIINLEILKADVIEKVIPNALIRFEEMNKDLMNCLG
ncbi:MAG: hypothetical protein RI952_1645 [Bacteroidota bacterium]|jgi:hypothetical protein